MKKFLILLVALFSSGCLVRSYSVVKDRVDQDVTGNQGYISGSAPAGAEQPKKFTRRATKVYEIELRSPLKFERLKTPPDQAEGKKDISQEGYQEGEVAGSEYPLSEQPEGMLPETQGGQFESYVVQKNDTLQKISTKFYGTTKKWMKIFEANKDKLKSPDRVRPGQEIRIPKE
ncbi:LysM peptidoglycan-binding domain-containing protein [bacterium]|nr:MAG: LysM peptidoglycan-binding domain-containing protein [bacterium]